MNQTEISVIVKVHNQVEQVVRCVESLLFQTFDKYEIILWCSVSYDASEEICHNLKSKYAKVKAVEMNSNELEELLNLLEKAEGKKILFVDANDFFGTQFLAIMDAMMIAFSTKASMAMKNDYRKSKTMLNQVEMKLDINKGNLIETNNEILYDKDMLIEACNGTAYSDLKNWRAELQQNLVKRIPEVAITSAPICFTTK